VLGETPPMNGSGIRPMGFYLSYTMWRRGRAARQGRHDYRAYFSARFRHCRVLCADSSRKTPLSRLCCRPAALEVAAGGRVWRLGPRVTALAIEPAGAWALTMTAEDAAMSLIAGVHGLCCATCFGLTAFARGVQDRAPQYGIDTSCTAEDLDRKDHCADFKVAFGTQNQTAHRLWDAFLFHPRSHTELSYPMAKATGCDASIRVCDASA